MKWGWPAALSWDPSQRRALLAVLAVVWAALLVRYACNPFYVSDPQPPFPARYQELADRIDPNAADWQTLAALPTIGEKRAKQIVAYREAFTRTHPGERAFRVPEDLMRIRGIGSATVDHLRPYLIFPATTRPAGMPEK